MKSCSLLLVLALVPSLGRGEGTTELNQRLRSAMERGLARVVIAANHWPDHTDCFSCHHQTLPMLAMKTAAGHGFPLDTNSFDSQAEFTRDYFASRVKLMSSGKHLPGGAATAGYGLWAMSLADLPPDGVTTTVVDYLLNVQGVKRQEDRVADRPATVDDGRWIASCRRPPMQASTLGDTTLALIGLAKYATTQQVPRVEQAKAKALAYMHQAPIRTHQDRLWRYWFLQECDGSVSDQQTALNNLLATQRDDGGFAGNDERGSDTYSTAQTLFRLCASGVSLDQTAIIKARDYLLRTQFEDGSWMVESHANKVQPYFDNGDPHGENQFLSTAATAWATAGLCQLLAE